MLRLENQLSVDEMIWTVRNLSCGTLAHLFGVSTYREVDAELGAMLAWVREHEPVASCWPEAYGAYCLATGRKVVE